MKKNQTNWYKLLKSLRKKLGILSKSKKDSSSEENLSELKDRVNRLEITSIAMLQLQLQQLGGTSLLKTGVKPKIVLVKSDKSDSLEEFSLLSPGKETTYH